MRSLSSLIVLRRRYTWATTIFVSEFDPVGLLLLGLAGVGMLCAGEGEISLTIDALVVVDRLQPESFSRTLCLRREVSR